MTKLNPEILAFLIKKTGRKEMTVRKDISLLRRNYGKLSLNAVAHIYALQNDTSVLSKLSPEERASLPNLEIERPVKIIQKEPKILSKKLIEFVKYETTDSFI